MHTQLFVNQSRSGPIQLDLNTSSDMPSISPEATQYIHEVTALFSMLALPHQEQNKALLSPEAINNIVVKLNELNTPHGCMPPLITFFTQNNGLLSDEEIKRLLDKLNTHAPQYIETFVNEHGIDVAEIACQVDKPLIIDLLSPHFDKEIIFKVAVNWRAEDMMAYLIDRHGYDINMAFHDVIKQQSQRLLKMLIHHVAKLPEAQQHTTLHSAIHLAIDSQDINNVKAFLDLGVISPTIRNRQGANLAIYACMRNTPEIAELLLTQFPSLSLEEVTQPNQLNVVHLCCCTEALRSLDWLYQNYKMLFEAPTLNGNTPLLLAAKKGKYHTAHALITDKTKRLNIAAQNNMGNHVGHYFVDHPDQINSLSPLIHQYPIEVLHKNIEGQTMIDIALLKGASHAPIVRVCLDKIRNQRLSSKNKAAMINQLLQLETVNLLFRFFLDTPDIDLADVWFFENQDFLTAMYRALPAETLSRLSEFPDITKASILLNLIQDNMMEKAEAFLHIHQEYFKKTAWEFNKTNLLLFAIDKKAANLVAFCTTNLKMSALQPHGQQPCALDYAINNKHDEVLHLLWQNLSLKQKKGYINKIKQSTKYKSALAYLKDIGLYEEEPITQKIPASVPEIQFIPAPAAIEEAPKAELNPVLPQSTAPFSLSRFIPIHGSQQPLCCERPNYLTILVIISDCLKRLPPDMEAVLYGSANYKSQPGDLDILMPEINSSEKESMVTKLVEDLISRGAVVTAFDATQTYGYPAPKKNPVRRIIPLLLKNVRIELVTTPKLLGEQAFDFTIGQRVYDLRNHHYLMPVDSFCNDHYERGIVHTIGEPRKRFQEDLTRLFRAVSIVAENQQFNLSAECARILSQMFSGCEGNPFSCFPVKFARIYQKLDQIYTAPNKERVFIVLSMFNILPYLIEYLETDPQKNNFYLNALKKELYCTHNIHPRLYHQQGYAPFFPQPTTTPSQSPDYTSPQFNGF